MNVLMVGSGKGSWQIRGIQLGDAMGARVVNVPTPADWKWADLVVLVKRAAFMFGYQARNAGVPIVWDALDFWQQPGDNAKSEADAIRLLGAAQATIQPALTIGATEAMAKAAHGVYLPHHSRPGLSPTPAREHVQTVAYEGNEMYLGSWLPALRMACKRRGWAFVVNPPDLREADIIIAFRDGPWDGWMCREWKSGVKVVNAMAAGRPIITQRSAALTDLYPHCSVVETVEALEKELEGWSDADEREYVADSGRHERYSLPVIAERYQAILSEVACAA